MKKYEREYMTDDDVEEVDWDEEFLRTKAIPVLQEMAKRRIVGFSDGEYWYEIIRKKEEE